MMDKKVWENQINLCVSSSLGFQEVSQCIIPKVFTQKYALDELLFKKLLQILSLRQYQPISKFYGLYLLLRIIESKHEKLTSFIKELAQEDELLNIIYTNAIFQLDESVPFNERGSLFFCTSPTKEERQLGNNYVRLSLEIIMHLGQVYGDKESKNYHSIFSRLWLHVLKKLKAPRFCHFIGRNYTLDEDVATWNFSRRLPRSLNEEDDEAKKNRKKTGEKSSLEDLDDLEDIFSSLGNNDILLSSQTYDSKSSLKNKLVESTGNIKQEICDERSTVQPTFLQELVTEEKKKKFEPLQLDLKSAEEKGKFNMSQSARLSSARNFESLLVDTKPYDQMFGLINLKRSCSQLTHLQNSFVNDSILSTRSRAEKLESDLLSIQNCISKSQVNSSRVNVCSTAGKTLELSEQQQPQIRKEKRRWTGLFEKKPEEQSRKFSSSKSSEFNESCKETYVDPLVITRGEKKKLSIPKDKNNAILSFSSIWSEKEGNSVNSIQLNSNTNISSPPLKILGMSPKAKGKLESKLTSLGELDECESPLENPNTFLKKGLITPKRVHDDIRVQKELRIKALLADFSPQKQN